MPGGLGAPPPSDHQPGWQYLYLASELERRLALHGAEYALMGRQTLPPGQRVKDPSKDLGSRLDELRAFVAAAYVYLAADVVSRALSSNGDEEAVRYMAAGISDLHPALVCWANAIRSAVVSDEWEAVYEALAAFAEDPLSQVHSFAAQIRTEADEVVRAMRAGESFSPHLRTTLTISIGDEATAKFSQAMDVLKRRRAAGQTKPSTRISKTRREAVTSDLLSAIEGLDAVTVRILEQWEKLSKAADKLAAQSMQAARQGDEDLAHEALSRRDALVGQLTELKTQFYELRTRRQQLVEKLAQLGVTVVPPAPQPGPSMEAPSSLR